LNFAQVCTAKRLPCLCSMVQVKASQCNGNKWKELLQGLQSTLTCQKAPDVGSFKQYSSFLD
jgi:hypothetical protein